MLVISLFSTTTKFQSQHPPKVKLFNPTHCIRVASHQSAVYSNGDQRHSLNRISISFSVTLFMLHLFTFNLMNMSKTFTKPCFWRVWPETNLPKNFLQQQHANREKCLLLPHTNRNRIATHRNRISRNIFKLNLAVDSLDERMSQQMIERKN